MKTLSIMPPWTWVMLEYGGPDPKRIENRTWATSFRGDFLIHASQRYDDAAHVWLVREMGIALPCKGCIRRGGIVGMARLVDCVTSSRSRWFFGPYGFVLEKCYPLPFEACRGALGFWDYPLALGKKEWDSRELAPPRVDEVAA